MQEHEIEEIPLQPLSSATKTSSEYPAQNGDLRFESPGLKARHSVGDASSYQPTIDGSDDNSTSPVPTTDSRAENATFRRRQAQMLPICILNNLLRAS